MDDRHFAAANDCESIKSASAYFHCSCTLTNLIGFESDTALTCGPKSSSQLDDVQILDSTACPLLGGEKLGVHGQTESLDLLSELGTGSWVPVEM